MVIHRSFLENWRSSDFSPKKSITFWRLWSPKYIRKTRKKSLTLRDTRTEFQNPSKANPASHNHDANLLYKKQSEKIKPLWRYIMLKNHVIWLAKRILSPKLKSQNVKLLEMTESICCFIEYLPLCKKSSSQLNSVCWCFGFNIRNHFWHAHASIKCFYVCLTTWVRNNSFSGNFTYVLNGWLLAQLVLDT